MSTETQTETATTWTEDLPMVSLKDVHKSFGDLEVLKGVSLDVMKGEVICIIGPSGSGNENSGALVPSASNRSATIQICCWHRSLRSSKSSRDMWCP